MGGHEAEETGVNESVFTILNKVAGFRIGSLVGAEDLSDKVNYRWTSSILIIATFLIVIRDFTFKPIQCYVPSEWPLPWEEYAENYCWVQNNYLVSYLNTSFPTPSERSSLELNYYQWVPFVLGLECLLVYMPHVVWRFLSLRSGLDPNGLIRLAKRTVLLDEKHQNIQVIQLTSQLEDAMELHDSRGAQKRRFATAGGLMEFAYSLLPCFWIGHRSGFSLFFLYLISKLLHLLAGLAHLFIMRSFLGFEELHFGWACALDLLQGRQWRETRVFPRLTFCDVPIKHLGQWNTRSIQCVLPLNVLNEKLYIFLWFWTVMCMALTVASTVVWLVRIFTPKLRQQFVERHMKHLGLLTDKAKSREEYRLRKEFISIFLSFDGLFLLSLIEHNVGDVCVTDIVFSLYGSFRARRLREDDADSRFDISAGHHDESSGRLNHSDSSLNKRHARPEEVD